jgi:DNA-binding transcriptional regulator GbsR (MarR family)
MAVAFNGELLTSDYKKLEKQIIDFFIKISGFLNLNAKATEIFAYLQIYGALTQEQLKELTAFSSSTISITLQYFLNTDVATKDIIPNSRKKLYRLRRENITLVYTPFHIIIDELEALDPLVVQFQDKLNNNKNQYPQFVDFFISRLNSIRNYIEAQRRAIKGETRYPFLNENVLKDYHSSLINYPKEILNIEQKFIDFAIKSELFAINDVVTNKILAYFITRRNLDQDSLIKLTGLSRSTISRSLQILTNSGYLNVKPKEYQKAQIYCLDSFALFIIDEILKVDQFIFSYEPAFLEMLAQLETNSSLKKDLSSNSLLQTSITAILKQIADLKPSSENLDKARFDLIAFLEK